MAEPGISADDYARVRVDDAYAWKVCNSHATAASAVNSAVTNTKMYLTDLSGFSDAAGKVVVSVVCQGSTSQTDIWYGGVGAGGGYSMQFVTPLRAVCTVMRANMSGTAHCAVSMSGFNL